MHLPQCTQNTTDKPRHSDTTASTLTFLCYSVAKNPRAAQQIYDEVKDIDTFDINTVASLPHLNGVMSEVLRLYPAATTLTVRDTPSEGLMIGDTWIPGKTKILSSRWVTHRRKLALTLLLPAHKVL